MPRARISLSLGLAGLLAALSSARAADPLPSVPEPRSLPADAEIEVPKYIFAAEDTLELPALFHMSEIEVTAKRLQIGDIVQSCIEQERANRERIESWVHTQVIKEIEHVDGYGKEAKRQIVREQMDRVFYRKPDEEQSIRLKYEEYVLEDGQRSPRDDQNQPEVSLSFSEMSELPFYLESADDYAFEILSREIVGDRVIYEVHLVPKSDFAIAPEGTIWIDTSNFQILREKFDFADRVPLPLVIRSIGPMFREREKIGDLWVWKRWIIRAQLRDGVLKTVARLTFQDTDEIPHTIEAIILFQDHVLNDDSEFPVHPREPGGTEG
jgi:hypothetical protein